MKFSIRDLLLLTVIVALALGWRVDHRRTASTEATLRESQRKAEEQLAQLLHALESRGESVEFSDLFVTIRSRDKRALYGAPTVEGLR
jgi:chromatin segregation and condensation protein Rec8/ScpA/Scc1 (kleisin family)